MILSSTGSNLIKLRLPVGHNQTGLLFLRIQIQDTLNAVRIFDLKPIQVKADRDEIVSLIDEIQLFNDTTSNDTDPILFGLKNEDLNIQGQILTSYSQLINDLNKEILVNAVESILFLIVFRI